MENEDEHWSRWVMEEILERLFNICIEVLGRLALIACMGPALVDLVLSGFTD